MKMKPTTPKTIDEYIAGFPKDVQALLEQVRLTIRTTAPAAEETISYKMPAFKLNGDYLLHFSAYKKHLGLYPAPQGTQKFQKALAPYLGTKSAVHLPIDAPLPLDLIRQIVKFRAKENAARARAKGRQK